MALDGAFLCCLRRELETVLTGTRIDKIHQPSREELVFWMRGFGGQYKLFFSTRVQAPRVHLTEYLPENPAQPPMFCMLLRKHLTGAKFLGIRQHGFERALYFDFEALNELGDKVQLTLAAELMGRNSNLILIGENGRIIDAVRRVDFDSHSPRPVLPGLPYELPPQSGDRADLSAISIEEAVKRVLSMRATPLSTAVNKTLMGLSPLLCREVSYLVTRGRDTDTDALSPYEKEKLAAALEKLKMASLCGENAKPYLIFDNKNIPLEYSFLPITQYGLNAIGCEGETLSGILDRFYAEKDEADRLRQRSHDILRVLSNASDRLSRKIGYQKQDLMRSAEREQKRQWGDLINANLHLIPHGADKATVVDYFDPACAEVTIPLDPAKTAAQNAQRYYKDYRKAQTAERVLTEQIAAAEEELQYLDTVLDALSRAKTVREIDELRAELAAGGYLRLQKSNRKPAAPLGPMEFLSSDGFRIRVGRNNFSNDKLTLRDSRGCDIWLHTKNIPGSHTVIVTEGAEVPEATLREAAVLAATFSKAADSSQVPVDYTAIKYVRKPAGAKPGRVIYDHQQTVYVTPDATLPDRLKKEDSR
ncbi:MAG: NFACT family protein [Clostridia bacterium]|nr:NFACT family protein [Clostridia bacterium]